MIVPIEAASQGLLSSQTPLYIAVQGLLSGEIFPIVPAAGAPARRKRFILPNGEEYDNPEEALYYLNKYLEAVIAPQASGNAAEPPSASLAPEGDGDDNASSGPSLLLSGAKLRQTQEWLEMIPPKRVDPFLIEALESAIRRIEEDELAAIMIILH